MDTRVIEHGSDPSLLIVGPDSGSVGSSLLMDPDGFCL